MNRFDNTPDPDSFYAQRERELDEQLGDAFETDVPDNTAYRPRTYVDAFLEADDECPADAAAILDDFCRAAVADFNARVSR